MKNRTDKDIMIELLGTAAQHSENPDLMAMVRDFPPRDYAILFDLLKAEMIDGNYVESTRKAVLDGITLQGRQFRDTLIAERDSKRWPARLKRAGLVIGGWLVGLLTANAKQLIDHFFK